MDTINVNLNNLTDKERNELIDLVKKANNDDNKKFPSKNENYFYIASSGLVLETTNDGYESDETRISMGNCFKTKEDAKFELERLRVLHKMREIAGDVVIKKEDTKTSHLWCGLEYSSADKIKPCFINSTTYSERFIKSSEIIFPNASSAQKAIAEIGEDTLKKYYFRIVE